MENNHKESSVHGFFGHLINLVLENKLITVLLFILLLAMGVVFAPFDWDNKILPHYPIPVDALPDISENQQIVFTEWVGRSPQDIEDQISYPLTSVLMGLPGVKTVRTVSMFGFSSIYVIFEDNIEFYWARTRILERLSSLPPDTLPKGVTPVLGPDSTALGQVYWYTLEGQDRKGKATGGWDLSELRSIQDWTVRYALLAVPGVSEVASVGGFVKEYQVNIDPDALRHYRLSLEDVFKAISMSNRESGAQTMEINRVEYVIRALGYLRNVEDIKKCVISERDGVPIYVSNVAKVSIGPAPRRSLLDKSGAGAVGGVVVVRYGANPMTTIKKIKQKIAEIAKSLPEKKLTDGTVSKVMIVPFYDRSGLINETLGTLDKALYAEILITIIVILLMLRNFRTSVIIALMLPGAILLCFVFMKIIGIDANIVALAGIAIAIGAVVDVGIVISENVLHHLKENDDKLPTGLIVRNAVIEVARPVSTAVLTTVISFLPIFALQYTEGKLFRPLAWTKTITLSCSLILALTLLPVLLSFTAKWFKKSEKMSKRRVIQILLCVAVALLVALKLNSEWLPAGAGQPIFKNFLFTAFPIAALLGFYALFSKYYPSILKFALNNKLVFLIIPAVLLFWGFLAWLGIGPVLKIMPQAVRESKIAAKMQKVFPGLGREFMPALDEGSFMLMPTTMPHASISEVAKILKIQDIRISMIPEVESSVGKAGRADTALDPAPLSMIETVINYNKKFIQDKSGNILRFKFDSKIVDFFRDKNGKQILAPDAKAYKVQGQFIRDKNGVLIADSSGMPFRQWRPALDKKLNPGRASFAGINTPNDIWSMIEKAAKIPGVTGSPRLQPIETRIVMLQSGMRATMGVKITGPDLYSIEKAAFKIEKLLKEVPKIDPATVIADQIVGKPYLEIEIDRTAVARYGVKIEDVHDVLESAVGGKQIEKVIKGRERYPLRIRYLRELRDNFEALSSLLVAAPSGVSVPLKQFAKVHYRRGPQSIKSEDAFLTGYVFFDGKTGLPETNVVEAASKYLDKQIENGRLKLSKGISFRFAGNYENQVRATARLWMIIPIVLVLIFIILYMQFKSLLTTTAVFSGVALTWAGGFVTLWFFNQDWFLNFDIWDVSIRNYLGIHPVNMSVAVWVGFLALFGIATDDGVVMASYIDENIKKNKPDSKEKIRQYVLESGKRRLKACLMTTATTILALLPVLTSKGSGADLMIPMAIPVFGGMLFEIITVVSVPVFCSIRYELLLWFKKREI
jgi:copper/silver efflux system protein